MFVHIYSFLSHSQLTTKSLGKKKPRGPLVRPIEARQQAKSSGLGQEDQAESGVIRSDETAVFLFFQTAWE